MHANLFFRWGNTPLDDAMQFGHNAVVKVLQEYQSIYTHTLMPEELSADTCPDSTIDAEELNALGDTEWFSLSENYHGKCQTAVSRDFREAWVCEIYDKACVRTEQVCAGVTEIVLQTKALLYVDLG